jgi:multiple sugar transport system substrate-binding protein
VVRYALMLCVVAAVVCAACGGSPSAGAGAAVTSDKPVTITFENYNLASAGIGRDATLKMLQEFQDQHPNITVETKATGSDNMFPSIQAEVAAGAPPDLAQLILREWDLNIENLPITSLTDLVPADELQRDINGTYPIHPKAVALTERNGKLWGLPYVFSTPTLFYNADLFRAAGLDPDQPPRTWAEVEQAGLQINARTGNSGLYIACIENDWCAQAVLLSDGARIMSEDRKQVTFGQPPAIEVFRFWQRLVQEGVHSNLSDAEALDAFQAGKVGMYLQTSAVQATPQGRKWQVGTAGHRHAGVRR